MKVLKTVFVVSFLLFCAGCPIIANLATETSYEKKVPAEYNLKAAKHKKIVLYIRPESHSQTASTVREYLIGAIGGRLGLKTVTSKDTVIVSYAKQQGFQQSNGDLSSPSEIAEAFGADAVLVVEVVNYNLSAIAGSSLYTGSMQSRTTLYDSTGQAIWPLSGFGKSVTVGFDIESSSRDRAQMRLANATAHCIVRYLYDCPKNQFKIYEETSGAGSDSW